MIATICPGCNLFVCDDCFHNRSAPYFARMTRKEWPEEWPTKGYKEKRNGKLYTVSAHDLILKLLKAKLKEGAPRDEEMLF